jgi:hypothetical protein
VIVEAEKIKHKEKQNQVAELQAEPGWVVEENLAIYKADASGISHPSSPYALDIISWSKQPPPLLLALARIPSASGKLI